MNDPNRAPIPDPFQPPPSAMHSTPMVSHEWSNSPQIVRSARLLTFLAIGVLSLLLLVVWLLGDVREPNAGQGVAEKIGMSLFYGMLLVVNIWLNGALKKGTRAAWTVQIILSALGLLGFPLGTLIHGYLLSQWFKPEVKAWFGQS
jgi:hypothetical protein